MKNYVLLLPLAFIPFIHVEPPDYEEQAGTTLDMNLCIAKQVTAAHGQLGRYLQAALQRYPGYPAVVDLLQESQDASMNYLKSDCDEVYQQWSGCSIFRIMTGYCVLQLTRQR